MSTNISTENTVYEALKRIVGEEWVRQEEPMRTHTTFRIGGPAEYFVYPKSEQELCEILQLCREQNIPWFLLGNGSNLLVGDKGIRAVVISLEKGWSQIEIEGTTVTVGAGALLSKTAKMAASESLTGLEFAAGIPGSIGGAVVMNAGAYGGEIKDVLESVRILTSEGKIEVLQANDLMLGYRTSCVSERGYLVLEAVFCLEHGKEEAIRERMQELAAARKEKQPLEYPSAGSTFKRPQGYFAAKLIDDAGLRGFRAGDAEVSQKHCGFVINRGNATAKDVLAVCDEIQKRVEKQFQVKLEMEVKKIGEF